MPTRSSAVPSMSLAPTGNATVTSSTRGELSVLRLEAAHATLEFAPQGAHVVDWTPHGSRPVLFLSPGSAFERGKAIRGGVPLVFPWFGPRPGAAQHGFARVRAWSVEAASVG